MTVADSGIDRVRQLAEEQTETAYHRTWLAEERTFSAWIRTGLASLATGMAIAKLMAGAGPDWLIRSWAALFVVVGGFMFVLATWAYRGSMRRLRESAVGGIPTWVIATLTLALLTCALTGLVLIFL